MYRWTRVLSRRNRRILMVKLSIRLTNIDLKHPIMNASGVMGNSVESIVKLIKSNVSAVVTKTLTLERREGYSTPVLIPLEYGLLNAIGLANPGIDSLYEFVKIVKKHNLPVIASISGRNINEYVESTIKALDAGVDGLELNMSCPHTLDYRVDSIETIREITSSVKSICSKPIWVKLSYSRELIRETGVALESGADAVVLINTIPGMVIDIYVSKPVLSNKYGGLSGPAIHPIAIYCIYSIYREYGCEIIGAGGIVDWKTAIETIQAGARALQLATAFYMKGYGVVNEILKGIEKYMVENNINSIDELIGLAHS